MKKTKRVITRRDFIRTSSYIAMGGLMGLPLTGQAAGSPGTKSRVVLIRDEKLTDNSGELRGDRLSDMLGRAMTALLQTPGHQAAWKRLSGTP